MDILPNHTLKKEQEPESITYNNVLKIKNIAFNSVIINEYLSLHFSQLLDSHEDQFETDRVTTSQMGSH